MANDPLEVYEELKAVFAKDVKSRENQALIGDIYRASCGFLRQTETKPLRSLVPGKEYFAFRQSKKLSRAVNKQLFAPTPADWNAFCKAISGQGKPDMEPDRITRIIYSVAISFFCFIDLAKEGYQKTPGTFFEYLIRHLFAWRLNVNPKTRLPVLNLDIPDAHRSTEADLLPGCARRLRQAQGRFPSAKRKAIGSVLRGGRYLTDLAFRKTRK